MKKEKLNLEIKSKLIKLINENSKLVGIYKIKDALKKASLENLDLIELNESNNISTCKLDKYRRYLYFKKKKQKKNQKKKINLKIKKKKIKEVKFNLFISNPDLYNALNKIKTNFLLKSLDVKVLLVIRGREIYKKSLIKELCDKIIIDLEECSKLLKIPNINIKHINMFFTSNVKIKN